MNKMQRTGAGIIITAGMIWIGWTVWFNSRTWCPVSKPLGLNINENIQVAEFTLNMNGPYDISIEAEQIKGTDLDTLACAMDLASMVPKQKCSTPPLLNVAWVLMIDGKAMAHGSSQSERGGGTTIDTVERTVGHFEGQSGHKYTLNMETLSDARSLAAANPKLTVTAGAGAYEFKLVMGGLLKLFAAVIGVVGLIVLVFSLRRNYALR
jgi:hypothetical protein